MMIQLWQILEIYFYQDFYVQKIKNVLINKVPPPPEYISTDIDHDDYDTVDDEGKIYETNMGSPRVSRRNFWNHWTNSFQSKFLDLVWYGPATLERKVTRIRNMAKISHKYYSDLPTLKSSKKPGYSTKSW